MSAKEVKICSTPTCPVCKQAKGFFDSKGIPYEDIDVAGNKAARDEMIAKSGSLSVPVIEVDGDVILGFHEAELKEKLGL
jgi:glutaredoxin-like YruB-family protein